MRIISALLGVLLLITPLLEAGWDVWSKTIIHSITVMLAVSYIILSYRLKSSSLFSKQKDLPQVQYLFLLFIFWLSINTIFAKVKFYPEMELHNWINYMLIFLIVLNAPAAVITSSLKYLYPGAIILTLLGLYISVSHKEMACATMINPNVYAGYLLMIIPLFYSYIKENSGKLKIIALAVFILSVVNLVLTQSASAFLGLLSAVVILRFRYRGAVISCILFLIFLMFKLNNPDVIHRYLWWESTYRIIKDNLFMGTGLGTFEFVYPKYKTGDLSSIYAHNYFLQMAGETGIIGIALYTVMIIFIFKNISNTYIKTGILSILIQNIFEYNLCIPANSMLFWSLVGLGLKAADNNVTTEKTEYHKNPLITAILVFLILIYISSFERIDRATRIYNKGEDCFNSGNLEMAKEYFEAAKDIKPDFWQADDYLVKIYSEEYKQTGFTSYADEARLEFKEAKKYNKYYEFYAGKNEGENN